MPNETLRSLADRHELLVGAAFNPGAFEQDVSYGPTLAREFNCLVAENIMKGRYLQPERGRFEFAAADAMLDFAEAHAMKARGHTLVWHTQQPDCIANLELSRAEALDFLHTHIGTVVQHFRGRVFAWDVVNEGVADKGQALLREESPWYRLIGPEYMEKAFRWAHDADPDAQLFYNDYNIAAIEEKADRVFRLVHCLLDRGVPLHGVGFQHHVKACDAPGLEVLSRRIERFRELGVTVHITELDLSVPAQAAPGDFELQAQAYRDVFEAALASGGACPAVVLWGFTDRYSWIPSFTKGECDHALLFDREYQPKPAYRAVCDALRDKGE